MRDHFQQYNAAFTPKECDQIIRIGKSFGPKEATVGHGVKSRVDTGIRESRTSWIPRWNDDLFHLMNRIYHMGMSANANAFGFDLVDFMEVQFTVYTEDQEGHYGWHTDNNFIQTKEDTKCFERKMSFSLLLSDPKEFSGGKLKLADVNANYILKERGSICFFPSNIGHEVTPVVRGCRMSLVSWFMGPRRR